MARVKLVVSKEYKKLNSYKSNEIEIERIQFIVYCQLSFLWVSLYLYFYGNQILLPIERTFTFAANQLNKKRCKIFVE